MSDPWNDTTVDVESIHKGISDKCEKLTEKVRRRTTAFLVSGGAGSGKTNIVARLIRRLIGPGQKIVFSWVNWNGVGTHKLWRHLRKSLVFDLLRSIGNDLTQLDCVLQQKIQGLLKPTEDGDQGLLGWVEGWFSRTQPSPKDAIIEHLDTLDGLDFEFYTVLPLLYTPQGKDAKHWLLGETLLPDYKLEELGLSTVTLSDTQIEDQSRRMVKSILALLGSIQPFVRVQSPWHHKKPRFLEFFRRPRLITPA